MLNTLMYTNNKDYYNNFIEHGQRFFKFISSGLYKNKMETKNNRYQKKFKTQTQQ